MSARFVRAGSIQIGGGARVTVQSMTNTPTADVDATAAQLQALEAAGCEIARISVYDEACAKAIPDLKKVTEMPLVADIHFDHRLALLSIENGIDKLRINPGNIGKKENVQALSASAKNAGIPIRIGVNGGSLERDLLEKYGGPAPEALVESALRHVRLLEDEGFYDIVVSLKSSSVPVTVKAYELIAKQVDYPLHIGVTEAGIAEDAIIKSSAGLGALLLQSIGDTLRVSITGDPVREVEIGKGILRALGMRQEGIEVISCPTCGRCSVDLAAIVTELRSKLPKTDKHIVVAVMGCVVNGPGEAREADIGIAFAPDGCAMFRDGKLLKRLARQEAVTALADEICGMVDGAEDAG